MTRLQSAILSFGIVNAELYSALLPLWEGFDEPAPYGYVESLWQTHRLPILGRTTFPRNVIASFRFAPGSYTYPALTIRLPGKNRPATCNWIQ